MDSVDPKSFRHKISGAQAISVASVICAPQHSSDDQQCRAATRDVLRGFVSEAAISMGMFDTNMRYLAASRRWCEDYGLDPDVEKILGRSHYEIFPEIPEHWRDVHRQCLAGAVMGNPEEAFERLDGSVQWVSWEVRPWRNEHGDIGGIIITTQDYTDAVEQRLGLARSQAQLRLSLEAAQAVKYTLNVASGALSIGNTFDQVFGLKVMPPLGTYEAMLECIRPADRERLREAQRRLLVGDDDVLSLSYALAEDLGAGPTWVRDRAVLGTDIHGMPVVQGILQNVTREIRQQELLTEQVERRTGELESERARLAALSGKLASSEAFLNESHQMARTGGLLLQANGNITRCSDGYLRLYGLPVESALSDVSTLMERVHPKDRAVLATARRQALQNQADYRCEYRICLSFGEGRILRESGRCVLLDGEGLGLRLVAQDVTDERELQAELLRARVASEAERRQVIAFMAERGAEARKALHGILSGAVLARGSITSEDGRADMETVMAQSLRLERVIEQIADFADMHARARDASAQLVRVHLQHLYTQLRTHFTQLAFPKGVRVSGAPEQAWAGYSILIAEEPLTDVLVLLFQTLLSVVRQGLVELNFKVDEQLDTALEWLEVQMQVSEAIFDSAALAELTGRLDGDQAVAESVAHSDGGADLELALKAADYIGAQVWVREQGHRGLLLGVRVRAEAG